MKTETQNWYLELIKPDWAPPTWVFGYVWTVLYLLIAISFGYVFYKYMFPMFKAENIPFLVILPFVLNLIFNFIFTPIQFGLKNNLLATFDIFLVLATILWLMFAIFPYFRWVVYMNIPYLVWVSVATVLQVSITWLNWGR